jgi:hypothetical protein
MSGCMLASAGRDVTEGTIDTFTPTGHDYRDDANSSGDYVDNFSFVGREGRGHEAKDHQSDGWTNFLSSPKARAIENNLGVD